MHLQEKNIIHRDLKLANILTTDPNLELADAKLADFGFARILAENSLAQTVLGTPLFMAPEIFNGEQYNFKADIWSLGVLSYEMLTGKPAFQVTTIAELKRMQKLGVPFPPNSGLSSAAMDAVSQMLRYSPADRPALTDIRHHPFFHTEITPPLPEPLPAPKPASPENDFDVIDEEEERDIGEEFEQIQEEDDPEPEERIAQLENEFSQGFVKVTLDLDHELYQAEELCPLAEVYEQRGELSIAFSIYFQYSKILRRLTSSAAQVLSKCPATDPSLSQFQERVEIQVSKTDRKLSDLKEIVANAFFNPSKSMVLIDSITAQVDETVLLREVARLLEVCREDVGLQRRLGMLRDTVKLAALAVNQYPDSEGARDLLAQANKAQIQALRSYNQ